MRTAVVFPAPFGPIRHVVVPGGMLRSSPVNAGTEPYDFARPRASIISDSCTMVPCLPRARPTYGSQRAHPAGDRSPRMRRGRQKILIDARVNAFAGAHGIARSVMKLTAHMKGDDDDLALGVLVNPGRPQIFPLSDLPAHAEVISTDIALGAVHRCVELARLIRAASAAVLYVPYPTFVPLIRPCPIVVTLHDCVLESDVRFAGGWHRQLAIKVATTAVLRRAAAITAPSQASLADIRQHYPSAPHPTLVPNGVDMNQFGPAGAGSVVAARKRYQLPDQFILAVG